MQKGPGQEGPPRAPEPLVRHVGRAVVALGALGPDRRGCGRGGAVMDEDDAPPEVVAATEGAAAGAPVRTR